MQDFVKHCVNGLAKLVKYFMNFRLYAMRPRKHLISFVVFDKSYSKMALISEGFNFKPSEVTKY